MLRSYLVDGRLTTIPAQGKKRQVILRFLLERVFTEDRPYPEKEVNQRLALFHPDVAALRRYLYDERYVDRDHGIYRGARRARRCRFRPPRTGRQGPLAAPFFDDAFERGAYSPPTIGSITPVVAVPAPVEDRDPLVLGIHEHVEVVPEVLHRGDGVLLEHRLDREPLRLDDPPLAARASAVPSAILRRRTFSSSGRRGRGASPCSRAPGARPCPRPGRSRPGSWSRPPCS